MLFTVRSKTNQTNESIGCELIPLVLVQRRLYGIVHVGAHIQWWFCSGGWINFNSAVRATTFSNDDEEKEQRMVIQVQHSLQKESVRLGELLQIAKHHEDPDLQYNVSIYRDKYDIPSRPTSSQDLSPDFHFSNIQQEFTTAVRSFNAIFEESIHTFSQEDDEFTCGRLPKKYDPHFLCSGIVDYEFILLPGITAEGLNRFGSGWMKIFTRYLGSACLTDVKRLICSVLYKPCVADVVPGNVSTYQTSEWGIALPFLRPCGDLCLSTSSTGDTCAGLLEAFGVAPNCGGYSLATNTQASWYLTYDYFSTPISQAAQDTTGPFCNDLSSTKGKQLVHNQKEKYVGKFCKGVRDQWWHADSNDFDSSLAPFLPPFVLQGLIDDFLYDTFEAGTLRLYPYENLECHDSRKIHICTAYYLEPHPSNALSAYFGTIQVPRFPHRTNCRNYERLCDRKRDCDQKISAGTGDQTLVYLYPKGRQVVETLDIGTGSPLEIYSAPYKVSVDEVDTGYAPSCPTRYKADPDPVPDRSSVVKGCALECPGVSITDDNYEFLFFQRRVGNWFAVAAGFLQILNLSIIKSARQNIFLLGSVFALLFYNFMQAMVLEMHAQRPKSLLCSSDTAWRDAADFGEDASTTLCTLSALVNIYQRYFTLAVMVTLAIDLWLRIVAGKKDKYVVQLRWYYMTGTAAIMLAGALFEHLYRGNGNIAVVGSARVACDWGRTDPLEQFYIFLGPMIAAVGVSFFLFGHSCYVVIRTSLKAGDVDKKPLRKLWRNYSMIFLFVLYHLVLYPFAIGMRSYFYINLQDKIVDSVVEWQQCVFIHNSDPNDPNDYIKHCGEYPDFQTPLVIDAVDIFVLYLSACILFYITLYKEVRIFWTNLFRRVLMWLGVKFAAQKILPRKQGKILSLVGQQQSSAVLSSHTSDNETEEEMEDRKGIRGTFRLVMRTLGVGAGGNPTVARTGGRMHAYLPQLSSGNNSKVLPVIALPPHEEEDEMVASLNSKLPNLDDLPTPFPYKEKPGQETERGTVVDEEKQSPSPHSGAAADSTAAATTIGHSSHVTLNERDDAVDDAMEVTTVTNPHCNTVSLEELV